MGLGEWLLSVLEFLPPPIVIILLAMSPIGEVRLSIPVAILYYEMGWAQAFTWSLIGNLAVVPILHWFYPALEKTLRRIAFMDRLIERIYVRTRRRYTDRVRRYQEFAVFGFIATPVPGTGAWSGALVAYIFGFPFRSAAEFYYAGIVASCLLTALLVHYGVLGLQALG
jgi:uncharacterized membrane protein